MPFLIVLFHDTGPNVEALKHAIPSAKFAQVSPSAVLARSDLNPGRMQNALKKITDVPVTVFQSPLTGFASPEGADFADYRKWVQEGLNEYGTGPASISMGL